MTAKRKPKFKVGQVVAAEKEKRYGLYGRILETDISAHGETLHLLLCCSHNSYRKQWFVEYELLKLTKRERGDA